MQQPSSDEPVARILALAEHVQPTEYPLAHDVCTIGRSPVCHVVVRQRIVSRLHARIQRDIPHYVLHDAGSANGTFVNGCRLREPRLLKDDDRIGLGAPAELLRFVDPDPTSIVYAPAMPSHQLHYDEQVMRFYLDRRPIDLTPAQFRLLALLYRHAGSVCTRESCARAIWGRDYDPGLDAAALDEIVSKLRGKLRRIDSTVEPVKTRRGLGYELDL